MNGDFRFLDDYDAFQHTFIDLDEFGSMSKDKVTAETISMVTKLTGEAPFCAPVADLKKIGTQYVCQLSTVLTTNAPDLGFNDVVTNPGALARRFVKVEVSVAPGYEVPGTCRIDPKYIAQFDPMAPIWKGSVCVDAV